MKGSIKQKRFVVTLAAAITLGLPSWALARDVDYKEGEIKVNVNPGEPTEVQFPGKISGGFKRRQSAVSIDRKEDALILFAGDQLAPTGEAIIVRLDDGRSYSMRIVRATNETPRDPTVRIKDGRGAIGGSEEEEPAYREKNFAYAPPSQISGFMREMMLAAEFGKNKVQGYRSNDAHKGEIILSDGTMVAKIDRIFIGPNLWGYVIDAENMLDTTQIINPASFRLDGTRAISARNWELAPRPMNAEQELAGRERTKIYIVTRAKPTT
jgi:hypothetical protein